MCVMVVIIARLRHFIAILLTTESKTIHGKYAAKFSRPFLAECEPDPYHTVQQDSPISRRSIKILRARGREADRQRGKPKNPADSLSSKKDSTKARTSPLEPVFKTVANLVMMVKMASATYQETNGTMLRDSEVHRWVGQDWNFNGGKGAPGWGFLFGSQKDPRPEAIANNWLTTDTTLNSFFTTTKLQNLTFACFSGADKEFENWIGGNRNYTLSHNEYFRAGADGEFHSYGPTETGNFSISYLTWNTHFVKDAKDYSNTNSKISEIICWTFQKFLRVRIRMHHQLLIRLDFRRIWIHTAGSVDHAFLSAYSGKSPDKKSWIASRKFQSQTGELPMMVYPNWNSSRALTSFSLSHGYRSTYSVNSSRKICCLKRSVENSILQGHHRKLHSKIRFQINHDCGTIGTLVDRNWYDMEKQFAKPVLK